ncbi:primase-helicase family protein [Limnohabitans sp. DCL3]|uniref:primase-helicase family protein n=1 Tax=Limnohabitans sp. DCL3 TaxID=3374103 RepID=UPI003A8C6B7B
MANPTLSTPLAALQLRFAIIDLSGEIRVVDQEQIQRLLSGTELGAPSFYKRADAELLMKRAIEALPYQCKPRQVLDEFWTSPATIAYGATAFTPEPTPASTLNFWVSPSPHAKAGNWVLLRNFLRDIICAGDYSTFDYLIGFMAHMIQKPEEKPGVMITLLGGQGTGKGVYFSLLRAIWPRTTLLASNIEQITGRFNACLERNFIICMDEALFAGDRRAMDILKSIITESMLQIEQKFQPTRTIQSVHRLFASSNHSHFGNIELDDRRFVFLRVSDAKQQDTTYFGGIAAAINDPATIGALVYYLQRKNLSSFDVRRKPDTSEHLKQKLKSLQGFDRFWYEVLETGYLNGTGKDFALQDDEWSATLFVPTSVLVDRYREFHKNAQRHQTVQTAEVAAAIQKLCPSAQPDRQMWKPPGVATGSQKRGLKLPDLATARSEFERALGGKVDWE